MRHAHPDSQELYENSIYTKSGVHVDSRAACDITHDREIYIFDVVEAEARLH